MSDAAPRPWPAALLLVGAAAALGQSLQLSNGTFHIGALRWLAAAFVLLALGTALIGIRPRWRASGQAVLLAVALALGYQFGILRTAPPGIYLGPTFSVGMFSQGLVAAALVVAAGIMARHRPPGLAVGFAAVLAAAAVGLAAVVLIGSPDPRIDVIILQRDSAEALLSGTSPYAITFPNIYGAPGERTDWGFPYPPLSLLLVLPAHLLGDPRLAHLVAYGVTGMLIALQAPSRIALGAAALFLFSPRAFFVLEQAWTEPLLAVGLALVVLSAIRGWGITPWAFGLLIALKQYMLFCLPLGLLLIPVWNRRTILSFGWRAALAAGVVTLPMVIWDVGAYLDSAVFFLLDHEPRPDALSLTAWLQNVWGIAVPGWAAPLAAVVASIGLAWWMPRRPSAFAAGTALTLMVFFVLNRQAFANYYFLVIAAITCAIAAIASEDASGSAAIRAPAG